MTGNLTQEKRFNVRMDVRTQPFCRKSSFCITFNGTLLKLILTVMKEQLCAFKDVLIQTLH